MTYGRIKVTSLFSLDTLLLTVVTMFFIRLWRLDTNLWTGCSHDTSEVIFCIVPFSGLN